MVRRAHHERDQPLPFVLSLSKDLSSVSLELKLSSQAVAGSVPAKAVRDQSWIGISAVRRAGTDHRLSLAEFQH